MYRVEIRHLILFYFFAAFFSHSHLRIESTTPNDGRSPEHRWMQFRWEADEKEKKSKKNTRENEIWFNDHSYVHRLLSIHLFRKIIPFLFGFMSLITLRTHISFIVRYARVETL